MLYAEGMLYCRDENGPISLVEATPRGFKLKGRFDQPDRSKLNSWPYLVIANGMLYVRDQDVLLCYDVREKEIVDSGRWTMGDGQWTSERYIECLVPALVPGGFSPTFMNL